VQRRGQHRRAEAEFFGAVEAAAVDGQSSPAIFGSLEASSLSSSQMK